MYNTIFIRYNDTFDYKLSTVLGFVKKRKYKNTKRLCFTKDYIFILFIWLDQVYVMYMYTCTFERKSYISCIALACICVSIDSNTQLS